MIKYADDTLVYYSSNDVNAIEDILNLENIGKYCRENDFIIVVQVLQKTFCDLKMVEF